MNRSESNDGYSTETMHDQHTYDMYEVNTLLTSFQDVRLSRDCGSNFLQSAASKSRALATLPTYFAARSESEARFLEFLNSIDKAEALDPKPLVL